MSRYWISQSGSNWDNTANWSIISGGIGGASVPDSSTRVYFDASGPGSCDIDIPVSIYSLYINNSYNSTIVQNYHDMTVGTYTIFDGGIFKGDSSSSIHTEDVYLGYGFVQDATVHISKDASCASSHYQWSPINNSNLIFDGSGYQKVYVESWGILPTLTINKTDSSHVTCAGNSNPIIIKDDFLILDGTFNTNGFNLQIGL